MPGTARTRLQSGGFGIVLVVTALATLFAAGTAASAADGHDGSAQLLDGLHVVHVETSSPTELSITVALPGRLDDGHLSPENFSLGVVSPPSDARIPAADVERLPADSLEVVILFDDSTGVTGEGLLAQQAAVVELVRQMETGTTFVIGTTTRGLLSTGTTDRTTAITLLADVTPSGAPIASGSLLASMSEAAPSMRRAVLAFDGSSDGLQLEPSVLASQLGTTMATYLVVVDGASPADLVSQESITRLSASSDALVPVIDRVTAALSHQYRVSFVLPEPLLAAPLLTATVDGLALEVTVPVAEPMLGSSPSTVPTPTAPPSVPAAPAPSQPEGSGIPPSEAPNPSVLATQSAATSSPVSPQLAAPPASRSRGSPRPRGHIDPLKEWWFAAVLWFLVLFAGVCWRSFHVFAYSGPRARQAALLSPHQRSRERVALPNLNRRPRGPPDLRRLVERARDAGKPREETEPFFLSADSAPATYAVRRSAVVAPLFLACFTALSAATVPAFPFLSAWYARLVASVARATPEQVLGSEPTVAFRPLLVLFVLLLSLFAVGTLSERLAMLAFSSGLLSVSFLVVDVVAQAFDGWLPAPLSPAGGIISGLLSLPVLAWVIFSRFRLPSGVKVSAAVARPDRRARLLVVGGASLAIVVAFDRLRRRYFDDFHVRFLGGLDSEFVIALLAVVLVLTVLSARDRRRKPRSGPPLPVAFLVPAYNEAEGIAECIRAIDAAASKYQGKCSLYIVDNESRDNTRAIAERALQECRAVCGRVLVCPVAGKSHALNHGLRHVTEEIVVRIDADTLVESDILARVVPWFWDPLIAGVSGLPLPKPTTLRWLYPLRLIEVYYGVAFLRVAQGAVDGIMVMPGLVATYRRRVLVELGGFGEGFNGEDADITMRIGRLGYRIITDPTVRVLTEVPGSIGHLREQRQRWARGLFHMASRNLSAIWMRQGPRGVWILPWSILNGVRRLIMLPVLLAALFVEIFDPSVLSLKEVSVVAGFVVGLQLVVISTLLLATRQFRTLLSIPLYVLFRLFRAYIAFETVLTLRLKPRGQRSTPVPLRQFLGSGVNTTTGVEMTPWLGEALDHVGRGEPRRHGWRGTRVVIRGELVGRAGCREPSIRGWPEPTAARTRRTRPAPSTGSVPGPRSSATRRRH